MNQELKEQTHKEFDKCSIKLEWKEKPEIADILQNISDIAFEKQKIEVHKLLDSLIDKTVQHEQDRIVGIMEDYFNSEMEQNKGSRLVYEQLGEDKIRIISLITNKSDINKNKE